MALESILFYIEHTPIMENQVEKKMEHEMETDICIYTGLYAGHQL